MNHAHLTLRPWRLSDAAVLPGLIGDPAVQRNLRDGLPLPIPRRTPGPSSQPCWRRTQRRPSLCHRLGGCGHREFEPLPPGNIHRCAAELGYYLGRAYWGRGS